MRNFLTIPIQNLEAVIVALKQAQVLSAGSYFLRENLPPGCQTGIVKFAKKAEPKENLFTRFRDETRWEQEPPKKKQKLG